MNLSKLISALRFPTIGSASPRLGKTDLGVLKVAFMVAALDGEVTEAEYAAFDALAKKSRGYTPEAASAALDEAMRSAGYLMLLSKRVETPALAEAFVREATAALPNGFAYLSVEEVRQAVVLWIAMGLSDGDYSPREKSCLAAFCHHLAELKVERDETDMERAMAMASSYRIVPLPTAGGLGEDVLSKDFVERVRELVDRYGDSAAAEKELETLIKGNTNG